MWDLVESDKTRTDSHVVIGHEFFHIPIVYRNVGRDLVIAFANKKQLPVDFLS